MAVILGLVLSLAWPSPAESAKLSRFLTSKDLAGRMVLDQNGQQIQLPSAGDRHPALEKGMTPTYLAIPLHGGEHLPASIPTLDTGSQQGENPVGPLNFDPIVKISLNSTLATAKLAVVDTPSQNYLVEFWPRRVKAASTTTTVSELSHLFNTSSSEFTKLTQGSMDDLEKFLHISSKSSSSTPSLNLEAQVLSGDGQTMAVPEPSTWMVFAVLMAGAGVLRRNSSRNRAGAAENLVT
jgi:hypothetical protein